MGSTVLETAVGLAFVFFAASLACSGIVEWLANILNKRAAFLLRGLRQLLDGSRDPKLERQALLRRNVAAGRAPIQPTMVAGRAPAPQGGPPDAPLLTPIILPTGGLTEAVFNHPLVTSTKRPSAYGKERVHNPSYVAAETFSRTLIDILVPPQGVSSAVPLQAAVQRLPENQHGRDALLALAREAGTDVDRFRTSVEKWYDDQMRRVTGWYKRWAKKWLIVFGLAVAIGLNVDALAVGSSLYQDESVRKAVVAQAVSAEGCPAPTTGEECLNQQRGILDSLALPIGWGEDNRPPKDDWMAWVLKGLGWLITALAAALGAPFWFEALGKLGSLRNTGPKPATTS